MVFFREGFIYLREYLGVWINEFFKKVSLGYDLVFGCCLEY